MIHDRGGEFCNKVMQSLAQDLSVDLRFIKAGRPMANEQAGSTVKSVKQKMTMIALENSNFSFHIYLQEKMF